MSKRSSMAVSSRSNKASTSDLASPRFLLGFSVKSSSETDPTASPTSILESKPFSPIANTFIPRSSWYDVDTMAVGLGIVDSLCNEKPELHRMPTNQESRMILFGSELTIQVPSNRTNPVSQVLWADCPGSPVEFGVKNKNSQLALLSPSLRSPMSCPAVVLPLPTSDMELSEDYTCVISRGPNPRTTHIFHNCIIESCSCSSYDPWPKEVWSFAGDSDDCSAS